MEVSEVEFLGQGDGKIGDDFPLMRRGKVGTIREGK